MKKFVLPVVLFCFCMFLASYSNAGFPIPADRMVEKGSSVRVVEKDPAPFIDTIGVTGLRNRIVKKMHSRVVNKPTERNMGIVRLTGIKKREVIEKEDIRAIEKVLVHAAQTTSQPDILNRSAEKRPTYLDKAALDPDGVANLVDNYHSSGWCGDYGDIRVEYFYSPLFEGNWRGQKWSYTARGSHGKGWAGVYWQYPENNWWKRKGHDLSRYNALTFWAKGEKGGEVLEIRLGGDRDSLDLIYGPIRLSRKWKKYTINLVNEDLSNVSSGFSWLATKKRNPSGCTFYVDRAVYEKI